VVYDPFDNSWTRMNPPRQPEPRSGGNMAYDAAHKLHILFGAQFSDDPHTWAYDLKKNAWRDLKPSVQPPTNRNDPVLAYDANGQVVLAVVRVADKLSGMDVAEGHVETWAFDAGKNTWTPMKPRHEIDGFRSRRRIMVAMPDQNLLLLENYANPTDRIPGVEREQQIWTYRYAEAKPKVGPRPPTNLKLEVTADGYDLTWQPSPSSGVDGYAVYRGSGARPWLAEPKVIATLSSDKNRFRDHKIEKGAIYYYHVRAVAGSRGRSEPSATVRGQPALVEDAVASVIAPGEVHLTWKPPEASVAGYHLERAVVEVFSEDQIVRLKKDTPPLAKPSVGAVKAIGPFVRLTTEPLQKTQFVDKVDLLKPVEIDGKPVYVHRFAASQIDAAGRPYRYAVYAYRIRAVNAHGVEGGAGPYVLTIPS